MCICQSQSTQFIPTFYPLVTIGFVFYICCWYDTWLFVTAWTVIACQAPLSIVFSRQEYWSGLPCPPPGDSQPRDQNHDSFTGKVKSESEVAQSCPTLCGPMDCSLPYSFIHGIFQARVLEWVAISFSRKLQIELPYDPAIPLLGIHTEEIRIEKDTCTPVFITALL